MVDKIARSSEAQGQFFLNLAVCQVTIFPCNIRSCLESKQLPKNKKGLLLELHIYCRSTALLIFSASMQPTRVSTGLVRDWENRGKIAGACKNLVSLCIWNSSRLLPSHILDLSTVILWI